MQVVVRIMLFDGYTLVRTLVSVPVTPGTWTWDIPPGETPGTRYRIFVQSLSSGAFWDKSNSYFNIL